MLKRRELPSRLNTEPCFHDTLVLLSPAAWCRGAERSLRNSPAFSVIQLHYTMSTKDDRVIDLPPVILYSIKTAKDFPRLPCNCGCGTMIPALYSPVLCASMRNNVSQITGIVWIDADSAYFFSGLRSLGLIEVAYEHFVRIELDLDMRQLALAGDSAAVKPVPSMSLYVPSGPSCRGRCHASIVATGSRCPRTVPAIQHAGSTATI